MKKQKIKEMATNLGVNFTTKWTNKMLIRAIQTAEGNNPCFSSTVLAGCYNDGCLWFGKCKTGFDENV